MKPFTDEQKARILDFFDEDTCYYWEMALDRLYDTAVDICSADITDIASSYNRFKKLIEILYDFEEELKYREG